MNKPKTTKASMIEKTITVKASVAEVWFALTDRDELENWWSDEVVLEAKVGGKFQERWEDDNGKAQLASGKVKALVPRKSITFTWKEKLWPPTAITECTFKIEAQGPKSVLTVQHSGWESLPAELRTKMLKDFKVGWDYHMKELKEYLDA